VSDPVGAEREIANFKATGPAETLLRARGEFLPMADDPNRIPWQARPVYAAGTYYLSAVANSQRFDGANLVTRTA
jgi:hypothetical protein